MKMTKVERLILENQRAIMFALVSRSPINKSMLRSRIDFTASETVEPRKPKRRRKPARTGAFSGEFDQGYPPMGRGR